MRVLQPKDGQTYLYFYEDSELNPSQNITKVKKLLRELGCKIGPAWKRKQPEYHLCSCDAGEFRLVNDVPAIFIDSENSQVIKVLAEGLIVVCHKYKKGMEVRLFDGRAVEIKDYIDEDYIVDDGIIESRVTENEIVCKRLIPDDIIGRKVKVSVFDPDFGEFEKCEGVVKTLKLLDRTMSITVEVVDDINLCGDDSCIYERDIFETEITKIQILEV